MGRRTTGPRVEGENGSTAPRQEYDLTNTRDYRGLSKVAILDLNVEFKWNQQSLADENGTSATTGSTH